MIEEILKIRLQEIKEAIYELELELWSKVVDLHPSERTWYDYSEIFTAMQGVAVSLFGEEYMIEGRF